MSKKIMISESELHDVIFEAVSNYMLNEGIDEKFLGGLRDTMGAMKDTFQKGGSFAAHKANRNLQTARQDIANLDKKYGREGGVGNDKQWANQMSQGKIDTNNQNMEAQIQQLEQQKQAEIQKITQKYDAKIEALRSKTGAKNDKVTAKAQNTAAKYRNQKDKLAGQRDSAYNARRQAVNANPYAGFKEE